MDYGNHGSLEGFVELLEIVLFIFFIVGVFVIICNWKVYKKAGKEGWEAIIPIYNVIVLLQIIDKSNLYLFLLLIPGIGWLIFGVLVSFELAKKFGQSFDFGVGLFLLNPLFMAILAFDKKYVYQGYQQPNYNQMVQPINNLETTQPVQASVCIRCGSPVNPGDKFCMYCGNQLKK